MGPFQWLLEIFRELFATNRGVAHRFSHKRAVDQDFTTHDVWLARPKPNLTREYNFTAYPPASSPKQPPLLPTYLRNTVLGTASGTKTCRKERILASRMAWRRMQSVNQVRLVCPVDMRRVFADQKYRCWEAEAVACRRHEAFLYDSNAASRRSDYRVEWYVALPTTCSRQSAMLTSA